jgi:hypothetical protein
MINTSCCKHDSMISRGCAAPDTGPPMIIYPIPVGPFSPRGPSPKIGGVAAQRLRRQISGDHNYPRRGLGRTFLLALIIFVVTTAAANRDRKRMVNEAASASVPRSKRELSGAIPQAS